MSEHNPYKPPEASLNIETPENNESNVPDSSPKIGGWLILVGIGIIFSPFRIVVQVLPTYSGIFTGGTWATLTTPGTELYNPLWAPFIITEILVNVGMVLVWIYIAFIFFSKKRVFPKWYIGILVFTFSFILVDACAIKLVIPNEPIFDPATARELTRSAITSFIWIPYMLISKRVKETFVK